MRAIGISPAPTEERRGVEFAPREHTVSIDVLLIETAARPLPFVTGDLSVSIDIEGRKPVPPTAGGVPADFGATQHTVVVAVERVERPEGGARRSIAKHRP